MGSIWIATQMMTLRASTLFMGPNMVQLVKLKILSSKSHLHKQREAREEGGELEHVHKST